MDEIGVIAVDSSPHVIVELDTVEDNQLAEKQRGVNPGTHLANRV